MWSRGGREGTVAVTLCTRCIRTSLPLKLHLVLNVYESLFDLFIHEDDSLLHIHRRENLKSHLFIHGIFIIFAPVENFNRVPLDYKSESQRPLVHDSSNKKYLPNHYRAQLA
jgi:hypothetical protein